MEGRSECFDISPHPFFEKWLGEVPYAWALDLQNQLVKRVQEKSQEVYVLGLEHPNVITFGKRSKISEDLNLSLEDVEKLGFQYFEVDRGGHATLHNPGQLVVYPILDLNYHKISIRDFVCILQKSIQEVLSQYGIKTFTKSDAPGIFTNNGKIGFIGIRVSRGVAYHGVSLNISNNLEDFSFIRSCGVENEKFDQVNNYIYCATQRVFTDISRQLNSRLVKN